MQPNIIVGVYTGTGSTVNLNLGFVPDHFRAVNMTDGDQAFEFFRGSTVGACIQHGPLTMALVTGAVESLSDESDGLGVKVMGMASESAKKFKYVATRSSAGAQNEMNVT